ncbi:MAG TPA: hypothetical protein EYQ60_00170 [Myxococcales bacterium]|nr:hypothetical protein [Myxococcales bacterium]HIK84455.1 hypothetical protein [Myxococcales bacterium]
MKAQRDGETRSQMTSIYNELKINDRLSTSGVIPAECFAELAASGFEVVINLLPDSSEYAIKTESESLAELGIAYVYIPVDFAAPSHADFEAFSQAMDAASEKKTWVHCAANWRVTAFTSLYLQREGHMNTDEAEALIAKMWEPDAIWSTFISSVRAGLATERDD